MNEIEELKKRVTQLEADIAYIRGCAASQEEACNNVVKIVADVQAILIKTSLQQLAKTMSVQK